MKAVIYARYPSDNQREESIEGQVSKGIYFFAGIYGVGKSTLCQKLSQITSIPFYSASDLISEIDGEIYGVNKAVKDKNKNQDILISAIDHKLETVPSLILAGHFCIFDKEQNVEVLPEYVFKDLHILQIVLLEAPIDRINSNIRNRDAKDYSPDVLMTIKETEHYQACKIAGELRVPFLVHEMQFDSSDTESVAQFLTNGE